MVVLWETTTVRERGKQLQLGATGSTPRAGMALLSCPKLGCRLWLLLLHLDWSWMWAAFGQGDITLDQAVACSQVQLPEKDGRGGQKIGGNECLGPEREAQVSPPHYSLWLLFSPPQNTSL